jgi:tetratricopeptide (TPR) repeat protein
MRVAWASGLVQWACVLVGIGLIALVRGPLVERYSRPTAKEEVSLLLDPKDTLVLSLGHKEALADYLFATTLVEYGLSFQERRRFESAYKYLDTISTLAPKYARPYLYADTLLTMRPTPARLEDYLGTRTLQERGLEHLPYNTELWSVAGQFAAYLAQPHLPPEYRQEFKLAGARFLARACELASNNGNIPYHCIAAAQILNRAGQREAVIRMLSRTLSVNDDPDIRKRAVGFLQQAVSERDREQQMRRIDALEARWKADLPHASRTLMSLLGPGPDVWRCTGVDASGTPGCQTTWRDWNRSLLDDGGT